MANTFFLANAVDGRVNLWCEPRGTNSAGRTKFYVINGLWNGSFNEETGEIYIDRENQPRKDRKVCKVWEGQVPPHMDYNEAFAWLAKTHGFGKIYD
jgi:hypothetical protein